MEFRQRSRPPRASGWNQLLGSFFEGDAEAQAGPIEQDATPLLPQLISARERFAADLLTGMPIRFGVASQGQIRWS